MNKEQDLTDLARMFILLVTLTIAIPIVIVWTVFKYFFIKNKNLNENDFC